MTNTKKLEIVVRTVLSSPLEEFVLEWVQDREVIVHPPSGLRFSHHGLRVWVRADNSDCACVVGDKELVGVLDDVKDELAAISVLARVKGGRDEV